MHIPLVPRCNIKCAYCNRRSSCAHENRPGLADKVLSVDEALSLVAEKRNTNLKIIGLSGPGDPFSDPQKLFDFMRRLREIHGDRYELCISTNGLTLHEHIGELRELNVHFITLTINAIDPDVLEPLVEWVKEKGVTYRGKEAAQRLLAGQMKSLKAAVVAGIRCKINTVIVPDVNQHELAALLRCMKALGAERGNLIPLIPVKGTRFERTPTLALQEYEEIVHSAAAILDQVRGCRKCRADAAFVRNVE